MALELLRLAGKAAANSLKKVARAGGQSEGRVSVLGVAGGS